VGESGGVREVERGGRQGHGNMRRGVITEPPMSGIRYSRYFQFNTMDLPKRMST